MRRRVYLGNGIFARILEPTGLLELTSVNEDDVVTNQLLLSQPAIENLLKFLERTK